ncbi:hypothetical protein MTO96_002077 [Rhipicephalus appendiculatus]
MPTTVAQPLGSSLANVISALVFGQRFRPEEPGGRFIERLSTKLLHSESFFSFMDFFSGIRALLAAIPGTRIHKMKRLLKEMEQLVTEEVTKREGSRKKHDRNFLDGYLRKIQEGTDIHYSCKRSCPGEAIALEEIFLYVTTLLQKFRVLPEEGKPVSLESGATPRAVVDHTQLLRFVAR